MYNHKRQLAEGDLALTLRDPMTEEEIRTQLWIVSTAITNLQTMEDLDDGEEYQLGWDISDLEQKRCRLRRKLAKLEEKKTHRNYR